MKVESDCPNCNSHNWCEVETWSFDTFIIKCDYCDQIYFLKPDTETLLFLGSNTIKENIPEMMLGTPVFVSDRDNALFLEQGTIKDKKHKHYKIKFISCNKKINGSCMWLFDEFVDPIPKEMIGETK